MKKNEFATFLAYVAMFAIAVLVGIFVVRPYIQTNNVNNSIIIVIVAVIIGIFLNSIVLEVGHLLGALAGKYEVLAFLIFGLGWKKKDGKMKFGFSSYDGLTGETRVAPKDIKKSSMSAFIMFPLLLLLLEVIVLVVLIVYAQYNKEYWLYLSCVIIFAVGGMIFLYNIFPAHLDSETDGYRMVILNKAVNKEAYNQILLLRAKGSKDVMADMPVYEDVTEFTASFNMINVYKKLDEGDYVGALKILQMTLDAEHGVSHSTKLEAEAMKLSIVLMTTKKDEGSKYYDTVNDEIRKFITGFNDMPSLRSYLLISGVIEGDQNGFAYGLEKADKTMKRVEKYAHDIESKLLGLCVTRVATLHPSWGVKNPLEEETKENK